MKKVLKTSLILLMAVALIVGFSALGCKADTGQAQESTEEAAEKFTVGYQIYYEGNAWSLQMAEEFKYGIETVYADMVEKVYYTSDEFDVTKQLNNFDDLVTKGCDIIFLCPLDPSSMVDKINEAAEMGIKVVVHAIDMDEADYISSVNVSDYGQGKVMAEWLVEAIGEKGEVALISGIAGTKTAVDVTQATNDVFDQYPDIELVQEVYTQWDFAESKIATQDLIQAYPNLAGILTHSSPRASAEVFIENNLPLIPITWMGENGALRIWKEYIEAGIEINAKGFTKPPYLARTALDIGMAALKGETVEKYVEVPTHIITEAEIDDYFRPDFADRFWTMTTMSDERIMELFPVE